MRLSGMALAIVALSGLVFPVGAQTVADFAVQISASVQLTPPQIMLSWVGDPQSISLELYRKPRAETSWGRPVLLPADATSYVDSNVVAGVAYEYRVSKWTGDYAGEGYICAGMELPLVESRGKVVLVVDATHAQALAMELKRLEQDFLGDGWEVIRHDVARTDTVTNVKARIKKEYDADPVHVRSVFLFGHVPVPYSGNNNPDEHPDHKGAWPSDSYYADMTGVWTDSAVTNDSASDPRNRNVPGDGKFDQGAALTDLEAGRVDMANLPAFPLSEQELLRQYLNKDHAFRHKQFTVAPRGLIDDRLGVFIGEAFAACGWRNFAPFFGPANTVAAEWLTTLRTESYLWGYGCGAGTYTSAASVATTAQLAAEDPKVVFTMSFGSYFGDWDTADNFLRAPLATPGYTLTSAWAGRPYWMVHHMALGETIGSSTKVTQNNDPMLYSANGYARSVSIALMGDPTLRMYVVAPPSQLRISTNNSGEAKLSWSPAVEPVLGYAIYRASSASGPFSRLNLELVPGTNFTDAVSASTDCYMVRAVKLEVSASGTYYNASQGVFQDLAGSFGPPLLHISRMGNRVDLSWSANAPEYQLETSSTIGTESWSSITNLVSVSSDFFWTTLEVPAPAGFFRLRSR